MIHRFWKLSVTLLWGLLLLFVGCSSEKESEKHADEKGSSLGEKAELTVWIMETGSPEEAEAYLDEVTEQFNETYPNVTAQVHFIPWLSAHQNLITAMAGGDGPHIREIGTTWKPEFAGMGALRNLDDVMKEWGLEDGWGRALEEVATYDDHLYGVAWYAGLRQLICNEEIL